MPNRVIEHETHTLFPPDLSLPFGDAMLPFHSRVLQFINPKMTPTAIESVLAESKLPKDNIIDFLRLVYGAQLPPSSPFHSVYTLAGITSLLHAFEFGKKWLDWTICRFWDQCQYLTVPQLFHLAVFLSNDHVMESHLIPVVAARLSHCKSADLVLHRELLYPLAQNNLELYTNLLFQATGALSYMNKPFEVACDVLRSDVRQKLKLLGAALQWTTRGAKPNPVYEPKGSLPAPNFTISIHGNPKVILVHDWILFSRWSYFRRLIGAGLEEVVSRELSLHSYFPPDALMDLLRYIYSGALPLHSELTTQKARFFLENGAEFDLLESDHGEPVSPFRPLMDTFRGYLFSPMTVNTALSRIRDIAAFGTASQLRDALRFLSANLELVRKTTTFHMDISSLPSDVCNEILLLK